MTAAVASAGNKRARSEARRVVALLGRYGGGRRLYILALVMLIFEAITAIFEPYPLAYLIDLLQGKRPPLHVDVPLLSSPRNETVLLLTAALVVLAMVNSFGDSMAEIYLARGGRLLGYNVRAALHSHLQRLSLAFHDQRRAGDMLTRVTSDVTATEDFVVKSMGDLTAGFLILFGTIAYLFYKSWAVAVVAVLIVPVLAAISNHYSQRIRSASKRQRASEGDLASAAQEMLTSIRVVQTYGRTKYETERFTSQSRSAMEAALETAGQQARFSWVVAVLEAVAVGAVVWAGLWLIDRSAITVGTLVLFTVLIRNMFRPTRKIIREWSTIGKVFASVERVAEVLDRPITVVDAPDAVDAPPFRGEVSFDHVHFAYSPEALDIVDDDEGSATRVALRDVNFTVPAGKVVALVGPSGAGKSTIAQLVPRLYDPDQGAVRIDDVDIRRCTLESLRSQISVVLQDTVLFSGTVAENIAYGREDATEDDVVKAAVRANADGFIRELPGGYATQLGERAANLSGGQRQRIAIARAFVRNTPILILDEPTTGLDAAASELVLQGLQTLMQGKTTLIITHNLNLIRSAHRILVIEGGRIIEQGDHESLLARGGAYASYCEKHGILADVEGASAEGLVPLRVRLRERVRQAWTGLAEPTPAAAGNGGNGDHTPPPSAPARTGDDEHLGTVAEPAFLDALNSPRLRAALPGLARALDAEDVGRELQTRLVADGAAVRDVRAGKCLYLGEGDGCSLRYDVEIADASGTRRLLVLGRVLADDDAAEEYEHAVKRLAGALDGRAPAGLARSSAALPDRLVVHAFPVDPDLPTLVDATDLKRVRGLLRRGDDPVKACSVELGRYARRGRCVLRYDVTGRPGEQWTLYGKVFADERGDLMAHALRALDGGFPQVAVPRLHAVSPELRLALLEALPGEPALAHEVGAPGGVPGRIVEEAALAAAALHHADISVDRVRSLDGELDELRRLLHVVRPISPQLADILETSLQPTAEAATATDALPMHFAHGDFTPSQLLSGPDGCGIVDFDNVCVAEPALDLGRYVAYLRQAVAKARPDEPDLADDLADLFLVAYAEAAGIDAAQEEALRTRARVYECVSLLRSTVHTWQRLKRARTRTMLPLLAREVEHLGQPL